VVIKMVARRLGDGGAPRDGVEKDGRSSVGGGQPWPAGRAGAVRARILAGAGLILLLVALVYFSPFTPGGAIRLHVAKTPDLAGALTARVERGIFRDPNLGQQFVVEGVTDPETGQELRFFYLKRGRFGCWRVTGAGTGP